MCFGSGGSKNPPPPQQPTRFEYGPADYSNSQRQAAAIKTDTPTSGTYGSELGSSGTLSGMPAATTTANQ